MNPWVVIYAIGAAQAALLALAVLAGFFPAFQASKLDPVDALRYE